MTVMDITSIFGVAVGFGGLLVAAAQLLLARGAYKKLAVLTAAKNSLDDPSRVDVLISKLLGQIQFRELHPWKYWAWNTTKSIGYTGLALFVGAVLWGWGYTDETWPENLKSLHGSLLEIASALIVLYLALRVAGEMLRGIVGSGFGRRTPSSDQAASP